MPSVLQILTCPRSWPAHAALGENHELPGPVQMTAARDAHLLCGFPPFM